MNFIYAYEIISFLILQIIAVSFWKKRWLYLYKNILYACIQYGTNLILIIDFIERGVNRYCSGRFNSLNVVFSCMAYIGALVLLVLFDIYYIAYTDNMKFIRQRGAVFFVTPLIIASLLVITSNYTHIFFWFDSHGGFHLGTYTSIYIASIIYYVFAGFYIIFKNRHKLNTNLRILFYLSDIVLGTCMLIQYTMVNELLLTYYGVTAIIIVLYITMHSSEPYLVHSSGCFSRVGFKKVVKEKNLYHKKFYCLAICICNIESISDYCLEDEINIMHERLGSILRNVGGRHNVYHIHSSEYMIMADSEKELEKIYRELRDELPGMMRINDKNISLFYRYFVTSGKDADYNYADYLRIIISMKKMAVDTNNDRVMLTYTGDVREKITKELRVIRMINELVNTGISEVECMPIFDLEAGGEVTGLEINPRLMLEDGYIITIEEFWSLSREMGCSEYANIVFWKSALKFAADAKVFEKGIKYINVNISPYHIASESLCKEYITMMSEFDILPSQIVFELSIDSSISEHLVKKNIEFLRSYGIRVCWDNFGVNSCNLNNIVNMPFDEVKVNHELVTVFCEEKSNQLVYIIRMLKSRGWSVSLDGMYWDGGIKKVKELGVKYVQGRDMAEFMSEAETREFLLKKGGISNGLL